MPTDPTAKAAMTERDYTLTGEYRNWRGEVRTRTVAPLVLHFGATEWHPEPGWLLTAIDKETGERRDFALADFNFRATPDAASVEAMREAADALADLAVRQQPLGVDLGNLEDLYEYDAPAPSPRERDEVVEAWRSLAERAERIFHSINCESGVCCCGDEMEGHSHPMSYGHSPVDSGEYAVEGWIKDFAALAAIKERKG